jgi:hypothetical protein
MYTSYEYVLVLYQLGQDRPMDLHWVSMGFGKGVQEKEGALCFGKVSRLKTLQSLFMSSLVRDEARSVQVR